MTLAFADRLVALRKEHGLSQEALADHLGISRQAVSKWERAEASPDTDNLIALAELYGITLDELVHGPSAAQAPADDPVDPLDPLPNGSYFDYMRDMRRQRIPYPLIAVVLYLVLGFCFHLWHPGWIIFLTIPLFQLPAAQCKPLKLLGNPITVVIIYLLLGFECGLWHPGWLVFFLIPLLQYLTD